MFNQFNIAIGHKLGKRNFYLPKISIAEEIILPFEVTWDPDNKGTVLILDETNLSVSKTGSSYAKILATKGRSSGKYYYEINIDNDVNQAVSCGLSDNTQILTGDLGALSGEWGYRANGKFLNENSYTGFQTTFATGDVVGIAVNLTTDSVWISVNGVFILSGDPVAGTNASFTNLLGTIYPAGGAYYSTNEFTGVFDADNLTYTPPTGFSAWADEVLLAATWDPIKSNTDFELTTNNTTVNCLINTTTQAAISSESVTGKKYLEISIGAASNYNCVGICTADKLANQRMGFDNESWSLFIYSGYYRLYHDGINTSNVTEDSFVTGDILGIAINTETNKFWVSCNGTWLNSGNPAAGTGEIYEDADITGNMYVGFTTRQVGDNATILGREDDFTYAIPTGFSAMNSN